MSNTPATINAALVLDRFVSASTAEDVAISLEQILEGFETQEISTTQLYTESTHVPLALLQVLQTSAYKNLPIDQGQSLAARIVYNLCRGTADGVVLQEPSPGRLVEVLIDVATDDDSPDIYPRVLCLQCLGSLCRRPKLKSALRTQLLQAPNGLHRLGDLLSVETIDQVRNEALLLATELSSWPSVARNWMFADVPALVMRLCLSEGGLTGGNLVVLDALHVLNNLLQHDPTHAELSLERENGVWNGLTRLLDLRGGTNFLNPQAVPEEAPKSGAGVDDLDDLLQSGNAENPAAKKVAVPVLTQPEEDIIHAVFDILELCLAQELVRHQVWMQYKVLVAFCWDMGLLPNLTEQFPCAVPSIGLAQRALQVTATYLNDPVAMEQLAGLDRLLYVVCTGGRGSTLPKRLALSQSALSVIRNTLSPESAREMLVHSLAPPPPVEDDSAPPPAATAVQKLLNTVFENLQQQGPPETEQAKNAHALFLTGSLSALSLFVTDEASRSMLLKLAGNAADSNSNALVEGLLQYLSQPQQQRNDMVTVSCLRFLCHWSMDAQQVVQAILSSTHSTVLSVLFSSKSSSTYVATLACLFLGLCLTVLTSPEVERNCGGWTSESILELMQSKRGVAECISQLESLKTATATEVAAWAACSNENRTWMQWYEQAVLVVRKRLVQLLTNSGGEQLDESTDYENAPLRQEPALSDASPSSGKSLQKLLARQQRENEELRAALTEATNTLKTQEKELSIWKLRVESTPTELDDMLTQYTSQNLQLEHKLNTLEEGSKITALQHGRALEAKETELLTARREVANTRQDRDAARNELQSLGQAYAALEQEYRRLQQQLQQQPQSAGEQTGGQQQQAQGQESSQQQLPADASETARLRQEIHAKDQDIRAKDEWMAMAVERIGQLEGHNNAIQAELASLQQQQAAIGGGDPQLAQQMAQERQTFESQLQQARTELEASQAESHSLRQALDQTKSTSQQLETSVQQLTKDLTASRQQIATLEQQQASNITGEAHSDAKLQEQVRHLQNELEATSRRDQEEIYHRESRIRELQARLEGDLGPYTFEDIHKRDADLSELTTAYNDAREWMEKAVQHSQTTNEQLAKLNREKSELQTRLDEFETTQIAPLTAQKQELEAKVAELQAQSGLAATADDARLSQLQDELNKVTGERDQQLLTIQQLEADLQRRCSDQPVGGEAEALQRQLEQVRQDAGAAVARWQESYSSLEKRFMEVDQVSPIAAELESRVQSLEQQLKNQEIEAKEVIAQWQASYTAAAERINAIEGGSDEQARLGSLLCEKTEQLAERDAATTKLQSQLDELQEQLSAKQEVHTRDVSEWQSRLAATEKDLTAKLEALRQENANLAAEHCSPSADPQIVADLRSKVQALEQQLESQANEAKGVIAEWQTSFESASAQNVALRETIAQLESKLAEQLEQAKDAVLQWQESYKALEASIKDGNVAELEGRVEELKTELTAREADAANAAAVWQAKLDALRTENSTLLESTKANSEGRVSQLETTVQGLKQQLGDQEQQAKEAIAEWQRSHEAVVAKTGETQQDGEKTTERILALEDEVKGLQQNLKDQEEEAQQVISEWKKSYEAAAAAAAAATGAGDSTPEAAEARVAEMEKAIQGLQQQLKDQAAEAKQVISQWQNSYEAVAAGASAREAVPSSASARISEMEETIAILQQQLKDKEAASPDGTSSRVSELEKTIVELQQQLKEQENESMTAISHWQSSYEAATAGAVDGSPEGAPGRISELEKTTLALQQQLKEQEEEAMETISQWRSSYEAAAAAARAGDASPKDPQGRVSELEKTIEDLQQRLGDQEQEAKRVISQWQGANESASKANEELQSQVETLTSECKRLEICLAEQSEEASGVITQWQESYKSMEAAVAEAKARAEELEANQSDGTTAREIVIQDLNTQVSKLKDDLSAREKETQEAEAAWQVKLSKSKEENALELAEIRKELESTAAGSSQIPELESTIQSLEQKLLDQDREAQDVIAKWQSSHESVAAGRSELQERIQELEDKCHALEKEMSKQAEEATIVIAQWQESYKGLEEMANADKDRLSELENNATAPSDSDALNDKDSQISKLREKLAEKEKELADAAMEWDNKFAEAQSSYKSELEALRVSTDGNQEEQNLRTRIQQLEDTLESQAKEAESVIQQWQQSYSAVETRAAELEGRSSSVVAASDSVVNQETIETLNDRVVELESIIEALREQVSTGLPPDQIDVDEGERGQNGQTTRGPLDSKVQELETRIEQQAKQAEDVISQWQKSYAAMEAKASDWEAKALALQPGAEVDVAETEAPSSEQFLILETRVKELETELEAANKEAEDVISQWQESYAALEERSRVLESTVAANPGAVGGTADESAGLQDRINDLESQLKEAEQVVAAWAESYRELEASAKEWEEKATSALPRSEQVVSDQRDVKPVSTDQEAASTVQQRVQELESQLSASRLDAEKSINEWKEKYAAIHAEASRDELAQATSEGAGSPESGPDSAAAVSEKAKLEARIANLVDMAEQQSKDAENVISEWQERYNEMQAKAVEWEYKARLFEAGKTLDAVPEDVGNEEKVKELEARIKDLVELIEVQAREANDVISEWQEKYEDMRSVDGESTDRDEAMLERMSELNARIKELETELDTQGKEAEGVIQQWQESYAAMEANAAEWESRAAQAPVDVLSTLQKRCEDAEKERAEVEAKVLSLEEQLLVSLQQVKDFETVAAESKAAAETFEARLGEANENLAVTKEQVDLLEQEKARLLDRQKDSEEHEVSVLNLNARIEELEAEHVEIEKSANETIAGWQESFTSAEARAADWESKAKSFEAECETVTARLQDLETSIEQLQTELKEKETAFASSLGELQRQLAEAETKLADMEQKSDQLGKSSELQNENEAALLEKVKGLEKELAQNKSEALAVISQWRDTLSGVEARSSEWESRSNELEEQLSNANARIADMESSLVDVQNQLAAERRDSSSAVEQLQEKLNEAESRAKDNAVRFSELEESRSEHMRQRAEAEALVANLRSEKAALETDLEQVSNEVSAMQNQVQALTVRCDTAERERGILAEKVEEKAIALTAAEAEVASLRDNAAAETYQIQELQERCEAAEENVSRLSVSLQEQADYSRQQMESLQSQESSLDLSRDQIRLLQDELERERASSADLLSKVEESEAALEVAKRDISNLQEEVDAKVSELRDREDEVKSCKESIASLTSELEKQKARVSEQAATMQSLEDSFKQSEEDHHESLHAQKAALESAQAEVAALTSELTAARQRSDELEAECSGHREELESLRETLDDQTSSLTKAHEELTKLRELCDATGQELGVCKNDLEERKMELATSEAELVKLQNQLETEITDAEGVVSEWESCYMEQGETISQLTEQVDQLRASLQEAEQQLVQERASNASLSDKQVDLEAQLRKASEQSDSVRGQLASEHEELEKAVESRQAVQDSLALAEQKISSIQEESEAAINELESKIRNLQSESEALKSTSTESISRLEARCLELDAVVAKLTSEKGELANCVHSAFTFLEDWSVWAHGLLDLDDSVEIIEGDSIVDRIELAMTAVADMRNRIEAAMDKVRSERQAAVTLTKELSDALQRREEELESTANTLAHERTETAAKCRDLETELNSSRERNQEMESQLAEAESTVKELTLAIADTSALDAERAARVKSEENAAAARDELNEQCEMLRREVATVETERDRLHEAVQELEGELREANDAMQLQATNEVTQRATEMTAEALRQQVGDMQAQAGVDQKALQKEHEARVKAEQEVQRLRCDLTALIGMDDYDEADSEIRIRAVRATEQLQRKERSEIQEIKEALRQALDNLTAAREEVERHELSNAEQQTQMAISEQHILSAKADMKLLQDKMDEMREAESTARDSMQYRISSLQSELNDLNRTHAAEIGNLQNSLNQVTLERDRLFQSLTECERSKQTLLSAGTEHDGPEDLSELIKLRVERAQLLIRIADESQRSERRVREALAADKSSAEADAILERELRVANEKALENAKLEIGELRSEIETLQENGGSSLRSRTTLESLQTERDQLTAEVKALSAEVAMLSSHLEGVKEEARVRMEQLTVDCRQAKARVHQLEREGRLQAEIQNEVARLRAQTTGNGLDIDMKVEEEVNPADEGRDETNVAQLYDMIQRQKHSMEQDRLVYHELLQEHDELLAILAHKEVQRESLAGVLLRVGGQDSVDIAMHEAQEKSLARFGTPNGSLA